MAANPTPSPDLRLTTEENADDIIVRGSGKITAGSTEYFQSTIRNLIPRTKRIVLDLTGVEYVDSSGLGALVSVFMAAGRADCVLELANPQKRVRDLFSITKLSTVFEGKGTHYFGGL